MTIKETNIEYFTLSNKGKRPSYIRKYIGEKSKFFLTELQLRKKTDQQKYLFMIGRKSKNRIVSSVTTQRCLIPNR